MDGIQTHHNIQGFGILVLNLEHRISNNNF